MEEYVIEYERKYKYLCKKMKIIKTIVLFVMFFILLFLMLSNTLNGNVESLIYLLLFLVACICIFFMNYYFTMQCQNLIEHLDDYQTRQAVLHEICLRYPKNKDRQNQLMAYLASLSYNSTSHELLETFQLYQSEMSYDVANSILELLMLRFHDEQLYLSRATNRLKNYERTQKLLPHNINVQDNILSIKINTAIINHQYQEALELAQQIHKLDNKEYLNTYITFLINNDETVLDQYLKKDHIPFYQNKIQCLKDNKEIESQADKELYEQLKIKQVEYDQIQIKMKKRKKTIMMIFTLYILFCIIMLSIL